MVDVASSTGIGGAGVEWSMRSLQVVDDPKRQLDRLVPLLHELVSWDLVRRAEDGSFVLRDDVQARLAILTAERPTRSAQVYVGRKCEHCERVALTRMVDGERICSTCSRKALTGGDAAPDAAPVVLKGSRSLFHWHRTAS
jgi:ribosomal protein L37AE/L43A